MAVLAIGSTLSFEQELISKMRAMDNSEVLHIGFLFCV
jgi:hypothetical protein